MAKLLKMFILLMTLGLVAPSFAMTSDTEEFDLKSLEDELRRLLDESESFEEKEKETITVPTEEGDVEKLEIEYTQPMTDALKQEYNAQPVNAKEEIIILDEDEDDVDENIDDEDFEE